jgi:hypothetical protein
MLTCRLVTCAVGPNMGGNLCLFYWNGLKVWQALSCNVYNMHGVFACTTVFLH